MPINETIPTLPTPPSTSDPANFDARADAFLGGLPAYGAALNTFSSEANALAETVNSDSVTASDASTAAAGSANFAGAWSSLSGGLNIPASVSHEGKVWLLTVSIPNVAVRIFHRFASPNANHSWSKVTINRKSILKHTVKLIRVLTHVTIKSIGNASPQTRNRQLIINSI